MKLRSLAFLAVLFLTLIAASASTTHPSLRNQLTAHLAIPDVAILTAASGILLLFAECNLPGTILPGATGLLLLLAGAYGLSLHRLSAPGLFLLLTSACLLLLSSRSLVPALAGTLALTAALLNLTSPPVRRTVAIPTALVLGASATLLGRIAGRARRNKAIPCVHPGIPAAEE